MWVMNPSVMGVGVMSFRETGWSDKRWWRESELSRLLSRESTMDISESQVGSGMSPRGPRGSS